MKPTCFVKHNRACELRNRNSFMRTRSAKLNTNEYNFVTCGFHLALKIKLYTDETNKHQ